MKNRMSRCAALIGTVLSLSSFAQVCQEVSLYKDGEAGKMETAEMTFPEAPEWSANWGEMEALTPPYIRLSGEKERAGDWTGALSLSGLPATVQGGNVSLKARVSEKARMGVWLVGDFGTSAVKFYDLEANKTYSLSAPVSELVGTKKVVVQNVGVGLFDVPAHQHTTLLVDDISLSCTLAGENLQDVFAEELNYPFESVDPMKAKRNGKFATETYPKTTAAYGDSVRAKMKDSTQMDFVLNLEEFEQISAYVESTELSAQESMDGWFRCMYYVERARLRDSVIANPKALFYEASTFAASTDNRAMPLLLGNVDYAYRAKADTSFSKKELLNTRVLIAGLPSSWVKGASFTLYYDPYFVSTNRKKLPKVEIYTGNRWTVLKANSSLEIVFESAGVQRIPVRLTEGGLVVNQNLFVEVR